MGRHERGAVFIPAEGAQREESWRVFYGDPEGEWAWVDLPGLSWGQAREAAMALLKLLAAGDGCPDCAGEATGAVASLASAVAGQEWEAEVDGHAWRITRA